MPDRNRSHRWVPPDIARIIDEIRAELNQLELSLNANAQPIGWGHTLRLTCAAVGLSHLPTEPRERDRLERARPIIVRRILAIRRGQVPTREEEARKASG